MVVKMESVSTSTRSSSSKDGISSDWIDLVKFRTILDVLLLLLSAATTNTTTTITFVLN